MSSQKTRINSVKDVLPFAHKIRTKHQEHLLGLYLNTRTVLLHTQTITIGTLNQNIVTAREVFAPAFARACCAIILIHNHPSGDSTPSSQDVAVTQKLAQIGNDLGVQILDHVIVTQTSHFSFRENNLLDDP